MQLRKASEGRWSHNALKTAAAGQLHRILALALGLTFSGSAITPAVARPQQAALVIDANTGATISAHAADEPRYPASLTKMMTLYVVFDLIEQGRLSYQTRIPITDAAASQAPSKLGLEAGSDIALIDAVKALITKSANDIAVAIADKIAGSEDKFAALMTQKARAIGMKSSTFKNASGLPNDQQVTTARDMVTLALRLHDDFPKHYPLFATREFRYGAGTHVNHNGLLGRYEGTEGIKTGYTRASGFNLVASVKRGQKHVVGAVFGGATAGSRNQTMRTLLNIALLKGSAQKTRQPTIAVAKLKATPEPKVAERPKRTAPAVQTAHASPPVAKVVAEAQSAPLPAAENPPSASVAGSKIEIAKVRPVLVAPRQPRQAPMPAAAEAAPSLCHHGRSCRAAASTGCSSEDCECRIPVHVYIAASCRQRSFGQSCRDPATSASGRSPGNPHDSADKPARSCCNSRRSQSACGAGDGSTATRNTARYPWPASRSTRRRRRTSRRARTHGGGRWRDAHCARIASRSSHQHRHICPSRCLRNSRRGRTAVERHPSPRRRHRGRCLQQRRTRCVERKAGLARALRRL